MVSLDAASQTPVRPTGLCSAKLGSGSASIYYRSDNRQANICRQCNSGVKQKAPSKRSRGTSENKSDSRQHANNYGGE
jgi:hypothetical protein